jgi:hypothetical protein
MQEKRYQVFVSSTYRDLIEHRQLVMKALLQMDAIPAGMELFPASDDDAWTLIQHVIDASDYYVVIIGGKYGSTDKEGVSYTEKEFDYAAEIQKPIMAFLHGSVGDLPRDKTETDQGAWDKLERFRRKVQKKHCKYWKTPEELTIAVLTSYHQLIHDKPAIGWVRGDQAKTVEELEQLAKAQQRVQELQSELDQYRTQETRELTLFAQGDERVTLRFQFWAGNAPIVQEVDFAWADLFRVVGQQILSGPMESEVAAAIGRAADAGSVAPEPPQAPNARDLALLPADLRLVKLQFIALRLITVDYFATTWQPASSGGPMATVFQKTDITKNVWKLTSRGSDYLAQLAAIRRTTPPDA